MSRLFLLICVCALVSCENKGPSQLDQAGAGVIGGTLVSNQALLAKGIVAIYDVEERGICTGSIIAQNFILTAAHCVTSKPSKMVVIFGLDMDEMLNAREPDVLKEYVRKVTNVEVHPNYAARKNQTIDKGDIAIIKFAGNLPDGYKPVTLLANDDVLRKGLSVTVAGYGVAKVDYGPVDSKSVPNLDKALEYGEVICDENLKNCLKVDMSGDGILRETTAPIAAIRETEVMLDESKGHGTCSGDSGGPAYVERNGQYYLFGVTSRGSPFCDGVGVYTNTVTYLNWIQEVLAKLK